MRCPISELECSRPFCLDNPKQPECRTAATDLAKRMAELLLEVTDGNISLEDGRAKFQQELADRANALNLNPIDLNAETRFIFVDTDFNAPPDQD